MPPRAERSHRHPALSTLSPPLDLVTRFRRLILSHRAQAPFGTAGLFVVTITSHPDQSGRECPPVWSAATSKATTPLSFGYTDPVATGFVDSVSRLSHHVPRVRQCVSCYRL